MLIRADCRLACNELTHIAVLAVAVLLKIWLASGESAEIGLDGSGPIPSYERSVASYQVDGILDLYWIGSEETGEVKPVSILGLEKGVRAKVNTFDGHIFYASSRRMRSERSRVGCDFEITIRVHLEPEASNLGISKGR